LKNCPPHVPSPFAQGTERLQHAARFGADDGLRRQQHGRIQMPCSAQRCPIRARARPMSCVQSRPTASQPQSAIASSQAPPPFREHDRGHRLALVLPVQVPHNLRDVRQREFAKRAIGQHAAPGIEQHDRLGSGPDLRVQVIGHRARIDREHPVHQVGPEYSIVLTVRKSSEPPPSTM